MIHKELSCLTSLRFYAAFLVFLFHNQIRWPLSAPKFITNIISQGAIGMSLFFVLSGFILTYNYYDRKPSQNFFNFMLRRFARIYPVYFVMLLLSLPWLGIDAIHGTALHTVKYILQIIFLLATNLLVIHAWFPALFNCLNDGGSWSLSVEFFCYALFPFILFVLLSIPKKQVIIVAIGAYIFCILPGIAYMLFDPKPLFSTIYAMPIFRLSEFVVGMVVCLFFLDIKDHCDQKTIKIRLLLTIAILTTYLGLVGGKLPVFVTHNFIVVPCFASVIYYLAQVRSGFLLLFFNNKLIKLFGEYSYSFYLIQIWTFHFGSYIYKLNPNINTWLLTSILLILNLILSMASYNLIENPFRKKINSYSKKKSISQENLGQLA